MTITGATLSKAMLGIVSQARYNELAPSVNQALLQAGCNTVNRAAMFLAQIGHESMGLRYMEEIASGAAYEGRKDLGNTQVGDGKRFKGRGPIQITGRHNYTQVSKWAHSKGYVSSADYFVKNPTEMASVKLGFIGAVWYWTVARNMNGYADAGDIVGATRAVNGGLNGLDDRRNRWNVCRGIGKALLPSGSSSTAGAPPASEPIYPTQGKIHTAWGKRGPYWSYDRDKNGNGIHTGDDWHDGPSSAGNPIHAVAAGRVIYAGNGKDGLGWGPAFGNHVLVQWDDHGRTSIDAHMTRTAVKYGQRVKAGDLLGYLGATGNVTGPHDHHEQHLGTGWGDKRVKPIYPSRRAGPTQLTGGIFGMSKHYYIRRNKDFTHKTGGWRQVALNNSKGSWTVATQGQDIAVTATLQLTGVPKGKEVQLRFIEIDYKKGATNIIAQRHPWIEVVGTGGTTAGQVTFIGKVGKSKRKGYQRRLRLHMNVFQDVEVIDLRVQGFKG